MTTDELTALRETAKAHGMTPGLFSRTLLMHAFDHVDDLADAIAEEKRASASRISAGATEAINQRWGKKDEGNDS